MLQIQLERHRSDDQSSSDLQMALSQLQLIAEKQHDSGGGGDQRLGTKIDDDFHLLRNQQARVFPFIKSLKRQLHNWS